MRAATFPVMLQVLGLLTLPVSAASAEPLLRLSGDASAQTPANGASPFFAPLAAPPTPSGLFAAGDARLCASAIQMAERASQIPDQFLVAMGRVESGRRINGEVVPWPWTVNAAGKGYLYDNRQQAIAAVRAFQAQGIQSIDVGCMQINLQNHANAFVSLEMAFDPVSNATYAAHFLRTLFNKTGSWPRAAAAYHSFTPGIGTAYQWKVLESWAAPASSGDNAPSPARRTPVQASSPVHISPFATQFQPATPYVTASTASASMAALGGGGGGGMIAPTTPHFSSSGAQSLSQPPSRPAVATGNGHSLAFYRANRVHLVRQAMVVPPRF